MDNEASKSKGKKTCPYCNYTWVPRVNNPKKCPFCGRWLPEYRRSKDREVGLGG